MADEPAPGDLARALQFCAFATSMCLAVAANGEPPPVAPDARHAEGIWKAATPPTPMRGEYGNLDPLGLVAGASITCDCSINWSDPDTAKRYCFNSATSLVYFLESPSAHIRAADAAWAADSSER